ncbi:hypothetical protein PIB30_024552 [Stylosanthes scabra]|uniref:RNase H type-1 domain-containing protein n=1 Tax=Stylosanthes scabra TaxID=79078 RepID=A0ABU6S9I6_9FABA|nr:hypothetical protein [Stylosanthes scabra]
MLKWLMLVFVIFWSIWKSRNLKIFENKDVSWEESWIQINCLVDEWIKVRAKRKNTDCVGYRKEEIEGPKWWQCCLYNSEENNYVVGGYFTDEAGSVKAWMGGTIEEVSQGEAYLQGLDSAIQFLLEELCIRDEGTILVANRRDIVDWINGNTDTG